MATDTAVKWLVVNEQRGREIQRRRVRLGVGSVSEFARELKLDRQTIVRAEGGHASERTYLLMESWLSEREHEFGMEEQPGASATTSHVGENDDTIEFRVGGNFGVDVVVKGPITKMDELEGAVGRLLDRLRAETRIEGHEPPKVAG